MTYDAAAPKPAEVQARAVVDPRPSLVKKRSVIIGRHKTSVSLEHAFWKQLREIAEHEKKTLGALIAEIDEAREHDNLSSAIRIYVLQHVIRRAEG
jgi:predicted DNA-binding ribbon-helix-helix protein